MEEIIARQRCGPMKDSSKVQKQKESRKQGGQGSVGGQGDSFKAVSQSKSKKKGITIKEPAL